MKDIITPIILCLLLAHFNQSMKSYKRHDKTFERKADGTNTRQEERQANSDCEDRMCPANFKPVCGSDGKTRPNSCFLDIDMCKNDTLRKLCNGKCRTCATSDCGTCTSKDSDCGTCTSNEDSDCGTCTREDSGVCGRVGWIDKKYKNKCTLSVEGCKTNKSIQYLHDGDCIPRYVNVGTDRKGKRCFNVVANNNALKIILQPESVDNRTTFYFGDFCNWKDCMKQCANVTECFTWALYLTSGRQHKKCYGVNLTNTKPETENYIGLISGVLTGGSNGCGNGKRIDDLQDGKCIDW